MNSSALEEARTVVQLVLIDETGDSYYRMRWPGRQISVQAPKWRVLSLDAGAQERFEWAERADLLVLFQSSDYDLIPLIERRRAAGKKTLVEYNDNFYEPPVTAPVYEVWSSPLQWSSYETMMNLGDGLIVTGPGLRELFSAKTPTPIYEIPNQLSDEKLLDFESLWPETNREIILGWGGSQGHMPDLMAFLPQIRQLMAEFPNLKLHLMGNDSIPQYLDIAQDRFKFVPWGSMRQYFQFLERIHLGFAPLTDTPYNRCRSDIKAVEMSSRGAFPLIPNFLPYHSFLKDAGIRGYESPSDFLEQARALLKDPTKLKEQARLCYDYVKRERLQNHYEDRLALFSQMMSAPVEPFRTDIPSGYFEIKGRPAPPLFRDTLVRVQTLFNNRMRAEAVRLLDEEIKKNSQNPELALAFLKLTKISNPSELRSRSQIFRQRFPNDLRFIFYEIESEQDLDSKYELWKNVIEKLRTASLAFRKFYRSQATSLMVKDLQWSRDLVSLAADLVNVYPTSVALRFELGRAYEFQGKKDEAFEAFAWVLSRHEDFTQDKEWFQALGQMELRAFVQSLSARN